MGRTEAAVSTFQQPWWLDAVAPGASDVVEIRNGNEIVAPMPFVKSQRLILERSIVC